MSRNLLAVNIALTAILLAVMAAATVSYFKKEKANRLLQEFSQSQNPAAGGARDELAVAQEMVSWGGKIDDDHYFVHNNRAIRRLACDIRLPKDYIIAATWQYGRRQVHLMKTAMAGLKIGDGQLSAMQTVVISSADIDERFLPASLRSPKADYRTPLSEAELAKMFAALNPADVPDSIAIGPDRVLGIWPTGPPLGDGIYIVADLTYPLREPSTLVRTDKNRRVLEMLELNGSPDFSNAAIASQTNGETRLLIGSYYQNRTSSTSKSFEKNYRVTPVKITPGPFYPEPFLHPYSTGFMSVELSPKFRIIESGGNFRGTSCYD